MRAIAKTLMVQGTASSVGKSILTAALCRILHQNGLRVAPFKAQNMALNSFVTPDGGEIGRAQAVQAEAAGIAPAVEMNPILLKPEPGMRSQVVILGKARGSMKWNEYHELRAEMIRVVADSLATLRREYDFVVIEGAGSPAEINLRSQDIVNMHVAAAADAPVLLAADIDRGGVFAQIVGTMELLGAEDRRRIAGFIINKFRGEASLLKSGLDYLESRYGLPVLGVVPFIESLKIADEDSVALDSRRSAPPIARNTIDIAVLRFPSISNFDDFLPLEHEPGVSVRFVRERNGIDGADLAILPGSKSTVSDLAWLRARGFDEALASRAQGMMPILGICGGCQMLGIRIEDPDRIESDAPRVEGLGLLALTTRFEREKRTTQVRARLAARSILGDPGAVGEIGAYEIHMGRIAAHDTSAAAAQIVARNNEPCDARDGAIGADGAIVGTMMHGIFDNDALRASMLARLRTRRGIAAPDTVPTRTGREAEYDRLADTVRASVDVAAIKRIAGID